MWDMKCVTFAVIIGDTRLLTKVLKRNLEVTAGKDSVDPLQKTVILEHHMQYGKYCSLKLEA
jgi:hypothetical protein